MHHSRISDSVSDIRATPKTAAHAQQYRGRTLIEANSDAVFITDTNGIISDVNEQMALMVGRTRSELIGSPCAAFFTDVVAAGLAFGRVLTEDRVANIELTVFSADASETAVLFNAATIYDRRKNLVGIFATVRDATEIKRMEQALVTKTNELACADKMKSEFLATMSHELRTPLTAILGFSEALLYGLLGNVTNAQKEYIQDIYDSGQHLLGSITDILDLSKIDAGLMDLHFETADLKDILSRSVSDVAGHFSQPRVEIDVDGGTSPFLAQLDLRNTKKIVDHMLSNAVKFSAPNGNVRIQAQRVPRSLVGQLEGKGPVYGFPLAASAYSEFLQLTVHDNGMGISPQDLPNVFQLFNQLDSGLERQFEGAGLGASMVQRLAALHEGTVAIASQEGKGTSFAVWLPLRTECLSTLIGREFAALSNDMKITHCN